MQFWECAHIGCWYALDLVLEKPRDDNQAPQERTEKSR
jgi:hypothetical protein